MDNNMYKRQEEQEENTSEIQLMFPGYQNHVYQGAFTRPLKVPETFPGCTCSSL